MKRETELVIQRAIGIMPCSHPELCGFPDGDGKPLACDYCKAKLSPTQALRDDPVEEATTRIDHERFEQAPCYLCGYNGEGYYQPDTHPCARLYHNDAGTRRET